MLKFRSNLCREAFRSVRERARDSLFPKEAIAALTRTCFVFSRDPLPKRFYPRLLLQEFYADDHQTY